MADEAAATVSVDAQATATTAAESPEPNTTHTNGDSTAAAEEKEEAHTSSDQEKSEEPAADGGKTHDPASTSAEPASDTTPGAGNKDKKGKTRGGVPEHKGKTLKKKKSSPTLRLDCKPGEYYWARLKGYPAWPAIVCDEEMLPESLLGTRPVSTTRPDGSLRDDFKEGGKNARDRTFPIMFLYTNEFQWMVNTSLTPLDPEECKTLPKAKMTKALQEAYKVASEGHDLDYFKDLLRQHAQEMEILAQHQAAEEERLAAEAAAKAEAAANGAEPTPKKKAPRKSKAADEGVEMADAEAPKSTKKRKKVEESDADAPKPKKTPKVTKLNGPKTPNGDTSTAKKSKPKKKVVSAPKSDEEEKPQMTEEERLAQREKAVLYLRHRLQKGFLSRDQAPQENEMANMAEFFTQLEGYENLEPSIIRTTKIHKVLKAIVKLASVPRDDEYSFKKRSSAMLEVWNKRLESDGDAPAATADKEKIAAPADAATAGTKKAEAPKTNGDAQEEDAAASKPAEGQEIEMKDAEASETPAESGAEKKADVNADQIEEKIADMTAAASTDAKTEEAGKAAETT